MSTHAQLTGELLTGAVLPMDVPDTAILNFSVPRRLRQKSENVRDARSETTQWHGKPKEDTLGAIRMTKLLEDVIEVARSFPSIQAVCYKVEGISFLVDFYAPRMRAERHFELTEAMLRVEEELSCIRVDFHTTCLPLDYYETSGFEVVNLTTGLT